MQVAIVKFFWALALSYGIYVMCDGLGLKPWMPAFKEAIRASISY